jgi:conjugative relaxase-like TrwC/TraI family protein
MEPGTIPQVRQDVPLHVLQRMGFDGYDTPNRQQLQHIMAGRRADGEPTGRRFLASHTRQDGKQSRPKQLMDIVFNTDISWGIALAGAETDAARAVMLSVVHRAADEAMVFFVDRMGVTRRGAERRIEQGELIYVRFTHHASRPTSDGWVSPHLHMHHVVPSAVLLPDGHVGAIHMQQITGFQHQLGARFHNLLADKARAAGIDIDRHPKTNSAMVAAVPQKLRLEFAQRGAEMRNRAKALGFDQPTYKTLQILNKRLQFGYQDGMATRPVWREKMSQVGWTPRDVVKPFSQPEVAPAKALTLTERAHQLRQSIVQTLQGVKQQMEHAKLHQRLAPSLARTAQIVREFVPELTRRARNLVQSMRREYTPERAKAAGEHIQRMATGRVMEMVQELGASEVHKTERMVRVYARKVHEGEVTLSQAAAVFTKAEERRDYVGSSPVHHTPRYKEGGANPDNRDQREQKWMDRIGDKVEALRGGQNIWPETAKGPDMAPKREMRMER